MPMTLGPGVPARSSWMRMYCLSSSLTVCQSRFNSLATSLTVDCRQRLPTNQANRLVERVVGQEVEAFPFHFAAAPAMDAPHFDVQVNARVGAGQVAHPAHFPVVPAGIHFSASATHRFFERRRRVMTRAFGSPKIPLTVSAGRNPGKAYASRRRFRVREVAIRRACQFHNQMQLAGSLHGCAFQSRHAPFFTHTITR